MIVLVPTYLLSILLILATGLATLLVLKRAGFVMECNRPIPLYFVWGVVSLSTIVGVISLYTAIDGDVLISVASAVLVVLAVQYRETLQIFTSKWMQIRQNPVPLFIFSLALLLVTLSVNETLRPGDTGGYHAQAVRWLTDYGIVAGIGNIIPRVAFNNHLFVLASLFDAFWMKGQFHLLVNGLFFLFGVMVVVQSIFQIWAGKYHDIATLLGVFMIIPLLWFEPNVLNTLYVEMSVTLLLIYLISIYLGEKFLQETVILVSALIGLLLTYKISLLPVALLLIPVILHTRQPSTSFNKQFLLVMVPFFLVLVPFTARNIIISGYPLYPMPMAKYWPLNFEWQMPAEQLTYMINEVKYWARTTGDHTNYKVRGATTLAWIGPWFKTVLKQIPFLFTALLGAILLLLKTILTPGRNKIGPRQKWVHSVALISIIWWFIQAPNIRLGYPWIFVVISLAFVMMVNYGFNLNSVKSSISLPQNLKLNQLISIFITVCFFIVLAEGSGIYTRTLGAESHLVTKIVPMPEAEVDTLQFNNGSLTIYLATEYGQCFYHKLPCTPEEGGNGVQSGIQKIGKEISSGFKAKEFR